MSHIRVNDTVSAIRGSEVPVQTGILAMNGTRLPVCGWRTAIHDPAGSIRARGAVSGGTPLLVRARPS
jgi:hypothetical protein